MAKAQGDVRVEIYDQEYHMRGDLDPEYLQKLAKFLDARMRWIAARTHTVDSLRVAVLAALNIADDFHQLKAQYEETTQRVDQKVEEFTEVLDELLKQAA